jgi:hypothetical protein
MIECRSNTNYGVECSRTTSNFAFYKPVLATVVSKKQPSPPPFLTINTKQLNKKKRMKKEYSIE